MDDSPWFLDQKKIIKFNINCILDNSIVSILSFNHYIVVMSLYREYTPSIRGHEEVKSLSGVQLSVTPWTIHIAHQAPLSMRFSRQEYWSGVAMSFSRGSSRPRDRTWVSHIVGQTLYPLSHLYRYLSIPFIKISY